MENIKLFVIHNDENLLNSIPSSKFIKKINLNNLELEPKYQNNALAENRFLIHLSNNTSLVRDYDYVGICSASWNKKYKVNHRDSDVFALEKIPELVDNFKKNSIYVPAHVRDWYEETINNHIGMEIYLDELLKRNNFKNYGDSFYSNNFICKKSLLIEFLKWWRNEFNYFFDKYKYEYDFDSESCPNYKAHVNCSYFYERLTVTYFANKSYKIIQLDPKKIIAGASVNTARKEFQVSRDENIRNFNKNTKFF